MININFVGLFGRRTAPALRASVERVPEQIRGLAVVMLGKTPGLGSRLAL